MQMKIETVTPDLAAEWLTNNPQNRNIRASHVKRIARDMLSGRWQLNGDTIRFNCDGSLIDGQHRLSACVMSGVSFQSMIVRGLDSNVRKTIDDGARRTHGDRLAMTGTKHATTVSAALKLITSLARGVANYQSTATELDDILAKNPELHESAALAGNAKNIGSKATISAYHYIIKRVYDEEMADEFFQVWKTCVPAYESDPVHKFRTRDMSLSAAGRPMHRTEFHRYLCRAIDAFAVRQPIQTLRMKSQPGVKGWDMKALMGE